MSEMIRFDCTACGKRLKAPSELAGRRVKCGCGQPQAVPELLLLDDDESPTGDEPEPAPRSVVRRRSRAPLYLLVGVGALVVLGVGGWFAYDLLTRVRVKECYALDMIVVGPDGRFTDDVSLGIRTRPKADGLDPADLEIVAPDGRRFTDVHIYKFEREHWLVIPVPEKYVTAGGLKLRQKSSGHTADLPAVIEKTHGVK